MSLTLKESHEGSVKPPRIPEGTYPSRISAIIDLGIQPQTDWQTGAPKPSHRSLMLTWTLPDEIEGDRPRVISKEYKFSASSMSNIVKLCAILIDGSGDLTKLLDNPCMLGIGSTNTGNAKVTTCMKAPASMPVTDLAEAAVAFDFDAPDQSAFDTFPRWMQGKIKGAENYNGFADTWGEQEEAPF